MAEAQLDQGPVDPSFQMAYMALLLRPSAAQKASLDRLLAEQQNSASPEFHRWLTPEAYADRFGLNPADMGKIANWLAAQGFTINYQARGRNWIAFSGDAAQIQHTFRTEIHHFTIGGEKHFANITNPSIPSALAGVVTGIRGLHDFRLQPAHIKGKTIRRSELHTNFTAWDGSHYLAPYDIAMIYDYSRLEYLVSQAPIVVVGQTGFYPADLGQYRALFALPGQTIQSPPCAKTSLCTILYGPDPGITADVDEAELDLELAGAVAPYTPIDYVYSTDVFSSVQYAIDNDFGPVISMSYGGCEQANLGVLDFGESLAQEANSLGITWVASSGDSGAAGCDAPGESEATQGLAVNFPASIPEVTAVGGTEFEEGAGDWSPSNRTDGGSALSYIPEFDWNDTGFGTGFSPNSLVAGGGGKSIYYPTPVWQTGPGFPNDGFRDVPDVALSASADHDGYLLCIEECPTYFSVYGGTSASAPVFAGMLSLLNQYLVNAGAQAQPGLGNINPALYALEQLSPYAFHDVTAGNNQVPCKTGTPDCVNGPFGYQAHAGYDEVTGLGSIDAYSLITSWIAPEPPRLTIGVGHSGIFTQGQGAQYGISVSNAGVGTTAGTVSVTETLPAGLTLLWMEGSGWSCTANVCTTAAPLRSNSAYPPITVLVSVNLNAPAQVTNQASVSGGTSASAYANDLTTIQPLLGKALLSKTAPAPTNPCFAPPAANWFVPADTQAVVWFQDNWVNSYDRFIVNWYTPSGSLYTSYSWPPASQTGPQCLWNVMNIAGSPPASNLGSWSVSVTVDSVPLFTLPFTILSSTSYSISGQVTFAGSGLSGVTMKLSGPQSGSTTSNSSGNYSFTAPGGGDYTVTPSQAGYAFTPPSLAFNNLSVNQIANFNAQCAYSTSPTAVFLDSTSHAGLSLSVIAGTGCAWSASADGFITIESGASGTGNGSVTYDVPSNTSGVDRTSTLTIGGQAVLVTQRETATIFTDVTDPSAYFFNATNLMYTYGITNGCSALPLEYCPNEDTTRGQMAVFLVRGALGGDNFTYSPAPYFTDVPTTYLFFKWIQKLKELGITNGCTATTYCPDDNVTRGQMAAFIIRARYGPTATFNYPPAPYFTDVPSSYCFSRIFKRWLRWESPMVVRQLSSVQTIICREARWRCS